MPPSGSPYEDQVSPAGSTPVARLLELALSEAIRSGAEVVEFRPSTDGGLVLWGSSEALTLHMQVPPAAHPLLVGRLKALLGHAPGSPGPLHGRLPFRANDTSANLEVAVDGMGDSSRAQLRVLASSAPA